MLAHGPGYADASRLRQFLDAYGWTGPVAPFLDVVRDRIRAHVAGLHQLAAAGDPLFARLISQGAADDLAAALAELGQAGQPP